MTKAAEILVVHVGPFLAALTIFTLGIMTLRTFL